MQAMREARRGTGIIAIVITLALLGILAAFLLVALDDPSAGGDARGRAPATRLGAVTQLDRADSIARLRQGASSQPSFHKPSDRPGPAFTGDRQDQIEHLRRD